MDFEPEDQEIIRLLGKIKDVEGGYPEHVLVARRDSYLRRIRGINLGIPAEVGLKDAVKDVSPSHMSPATSTLVETALVVAIIAEASTVAYFYRERLADFFHKTVVEPNEQDTPPSVLPTLLGLQEITPSPATTATLPSATIWSPPTPTRIWVTPSWTPIPGVVDNNGNNSTTTGEPGLLNSTPVPNNSNSSGNNGNNGNHYGQTPKPERTKEKGNNPPPKEDKPPKEKEDKPPKENEDKPPKDSNGKPPQN